MRKPFKHTEMSDKVCSHCGKPLKKNLLHKQPKANVCYRCFKQK
jgi:formylmethanofuran dehydrogenase subunit E